MKVYYEVYQNANIISPVTGKRVNGNKKILTTKSRTKALELFEKNKASRWVEEIMDHGSGESTDIIAP